MYSRLWGKSSTPLSFSYSSEKKRKSSTPVSCPLYEIILKTVTFSVFTQISFSNEKQNTKYQEKKKTSKNKKNELSTVVSASLDPSSDALSLFRVGPESENQQDSDMSLLISRLEQWVYRRYLDQAPVDTEGFQSELLSRSVYQLQLVRNFTRKETHRTEIFKINEVWKSVLLRV